MKISLYLMIAVSICLLLIGGMAWIGAERIEGRFEATMAALGSSGSARWVSELDADHRPLAEANVTALSKMTTTMGKALWVIKTLGVCLVASALCLFVLGVQRLRQRRNGRVTNDADALPQR